MGLTKLTRIVAGGATRQASVLAGLAAVSAETDYICIHDGARPLILPEQIDRVAIMAFTTRAAAAATPATDTVKRIDRKGNIRETIDRSTVWLAQTPQIFYLPLYYAAVEHANKEGLTVTDDCMLAESAGFSVRLVDCGKENFKITVPTDLCMAEAILRERTKGEVSMQPMRIGHGYDVHRLVLSRKLILGGVTVPHTMGLLGHSDADVLTHAVMDAVLGALALGDIGAQFPDTDPTYAGADSLQLAAETAKMIALRGWRVGNIDATLLAQKPKLAPYLSEMAANLAAVYGVPADAVSVKATTEEKLGFTGAEQGIAAHAVCLLVKS